MNIMKKFLSALFAGFLLALPAAELLSNGNFASLSKAGLPLEWDFRGPVSLFHPGENSLTLGGDASANLMAIHWNLPLVPGKSYQVSFRSVGKAKFRCYLEWGFMKDGKKQLKAAGSQWRTAVPEGKEESYRFTLPADAMTPYLVLNTRSGETVTISSLQIRECAIVPAAAVPETGKVELLPNADFSVLRPDGIPQRWGIRGDASGFAFGKDTVTIKGTPMWLTAGRLPLIGRKGKVTFRVRGEGEYRVYVEYYTEENGKKGSKATNTAYLPVPETETERTIAFSVPPTAYAVTLAIVVKSEKGVTLSHFRIEAEEVEQFTLIRGQETRLPLPQLLPDQRYRLSYQAKGEGESGDTTGYHHFAFRVRHAAVPETELFREDSWNNSFQNKSLEFITSASGQPELTAFSETAGKVLLQHLSVKAVADAMPSERILLTSPAYRGSFFSSHRENAVAGYIIAEASFLSGTAELASHRCDLQKENGRWSFSLPRATGKLTVTLIPEKGGNPLLLTREITEAPPAAHEVLFNAEHQLLFDGIPFYPVAFWNLERGDAVHAAARNGVNAARFNCRSAGALLDALEDCRKNKMKLIAGLPAFPKEDSADAYRQWQHGVENLLSREVREHPALLGYFMADEPRWVGFPLVMMRRCYEFLSHFDPYHPIWNNAAPRGTVDEQRPYAACCDIFGVDIYPVPQPNTHPHLEDRTMSCVGKYVHWCKAITDDAKPVWMALQGFSWAQLKGNSDLKGYPTRQQTRFMIYDAVINGADGLSWWGLYTITQAQFYHDLLAETADFQKFTGALLAGKADPVVRRGAMESRLWHCEKGTLLISANTGDRPEAGFAPYEVRISVTGDLPPPAWQPPAARPGIAGIEPLIANMDRKRNSRPYPGAPGLCWIWHTELCNTPGSVIFARRDFTVKSPVRQAFLRYAADDAVTQIEIDGKALKPTEGHAYLEEEELTAQLTPGKHTLFFRAADQGTLPCGLLADLEIIYADGSREHIVSDGSFETAPAADGPWKAAGKVQPYGGAPWGEGRVLGKQEK